VPSKVLPSQLLKRKQLNRIKAFRWECLQRFKAPKAFQEKYSQGISREVVANPN
jgi:hypothetical protein